MQGACAACCFLRLVETRSGRTKRLCMLTGEKRPVAGITGCVFTPGQWQDIDAILGLPKSRLCGNTDNPKPCEARQGFSKNGRKFAITDTFAIGDFSASPISHIAEKLVGSLVRPEYREVPVARMARERTRLPFCF